jgi:prepilin-type N-terminal cleavage/methylation domain-containing protein
MPAIARGNRLVPSGFTLVELLVVTAIIGTLVALLLPALQTAREASRRASCSNNFRQIGSAIHLYHDAHNGFPPGGVSEGVCCKQENRTTWTIQILPFMDQLPLYERYSQAQYNEARGNRAVREHFVANYSCPSDIDRKTLQKPDSGQPGNGMPYMPGSYRGVGGRSDGLSFWDSMSNNREDERGNVIEVIRKLPHRWRGVFHVNDGKLSPETSASVTDGLSNTIMVGEYATRRSKTIGLQRRTLWAYTYGPYNKSDVIPQSRTLLGDGDRCNAIRGIGKDATCRRAWGSFHPGVVGFLLCDGSIRHVPLTIDMQCLAATATVAGKEFAPLSK